MVESMRRLEEEEARKTGDFIFVLEVERKHREGRGLQTEKLVSTSKTRERAKRMRILLD